MTVSDHTEELHGPCPRCGETEHLHAGVESDQFVYAQCDRCGFKVGRSVLNERTHLSAAVAAWESLTRPLPWFLRCSPVVDVRVTREEHYRLRKHEDACGIPGYNFDDARWMEGCREILGERCPAPYHTGRIIVVPDRESFPHDLLALLDMT